VIDSELDLEHLKEEFDSLPDDGEPSVETKKTALEDIEKQAVAYYRLWSHASRKGMLEFFKMIAESEAFISAYVPNVVTKAESILLLNKDLVHISLIEEADLDVEELEPQFQWFNDLHCHCSDDLLLDDDGVFYCGNCQEKRYPFDKIEKRRL